MKLTEATAKALALDAKEAADAGDVSNSDIRRWLEDAIRDIRADMDGYCWCYLTDFIGDGESGTVYFCCDGDLTAAPYTITQAADSVSISIDMEQAVDVVQATTYKREGNEGDVAIAMEAKGRMKAMAAKFKKAAVAVKKDAEPKEKASESARTQEAGARHSKTDQALIQNIHDHAIALGAAAPTANDNNVEEAATVELVGDIVNLREGAVGQDGTVLLKVITPGWGSSGYYSEAVLKRDLPKIYPAGTKNFWDHQTDAEEAARPEGSLRDLASVTTEPVKYLKDGPDGAGGYVRAKAFEAFKQPIDDLAKYIGTSIRASGRAKEGKAPDGKTGPIIEQLTYGHSIDYVTTPGAGGKVLQLFEAARGRIREAIQQPTQEPTMAEDQKLTEALAKIKKLEDRQHMSEAAGAVAEYFASITVPSMLKPLVERITTRVTAGNLPVTESGELDRKKIKEAAQSEYTEELGVLRRINPSMVTGMGSAPTQMSEAQVVERQKQERVQVAESSTRFASLMGFEPESTMAPKIFAEGRRAFNPAYNARKHGAATQNNRGSLPLEA